MLVPAVAYVVLALVVGVVLGFARGGRLRHLAAAEVRWWWLLPVAVALQLASIATAGGAGVALLLASFAAIITFTAANITRPGMGIVLIGVALNAVVIAANGGMPVRESAIVASGLADEDEIDDLDFNAKWHLETEDDVLTVLGDIIPVPFAREVLSFGDLVMAVGVADVIVHLMLGPAGLRRPEPEVSASTDTG